MKTLLSLTLVLFLASCGFHQGTMVSNASLGNNDFEIIDMVSAKSYTKRYFGLGALDKKALVFDTKQKLYNNNPLKKNQTFANISVDFHNTTIFFVNKVTCTISADLVQFGSVESDSLHKAFEKLQTHKNLKKVVVEEDNLNYTIGQTVYFKSGNAVGKGKIKSIAKQLNLIQVTAYEQSYNLNPDFIFYQLKDENIPESIKDYDPEAEVMFLEDGAEKYGSIVGANEKFVVVKSMNDLFVRTPSEVKF
jgi:hypothetical protein